MSEIDPVKQHALSSSLEDAKAANTLIQASGQALLLINGGASTAILTFSATSSAPIKVGVIPLATALVFFTLGAVSSAVLLFFHSRSLQSWSMYWAVRAGLWENENQETLRAESYAFNKKVGRIFRLTVVLFTFGITSLALTLLIGAYTNIGSWISFESQSIIEINCIFRANFFKATAGQV